MVSNRSFAQSRRAEAVNIWNITQHVQTKTFMNGKVETNVFSMMDRPKY